MEKLNFRNSHELDKFLTRRGQTRYALSFWPEAPDQGETIYFSDTLRPLLMHAIGFEKNAVSLVPSAEGIPNTWDVLNLDDPLCVQGDSLDEATENFWTVIEEEIRDMGRECQLFEKGAPAPNNLKVFIREWKFVEEVRMLASVRPFSSVPKKLSGTLRLVANH